MPWRVNLRTRALDISYCRSANQARLVFTQQPNAPESLQTWQQCHRPLQQHVHKQHYGEHFTYLFINWPAEEGSRDHRWGLDYPGHHIQPRQSPWQSICKTDHGGLSFLTHDHEIFRAAQTSPRAQQEELLAI